MVGIQLDKAGFDLTTGQTALALHRAFGAVREIQVYLAGKTSQELVTAGLCESTADADNLKSAYADLDQLRTLYEGSAALAAAKDFRTFARRVTGLGV